MSAKKNFPLRIDPKLYEILERWAADEFRSVNAHLEYLLRDAAYRAGRLPGGRQPANRTAASGPDANEPSEPDTGNPSSNSRMAPGQPDNPPPSGNDRS